MLNLKYSMWPSDIKCMLKEGRPTMQDIQCLVRELSCNPDEKRNFYNLLGISDYGDIDGVPINSASDVTDGVSILRHPMEKELKDVTYQDLAAVLDHRSLNRRDLAFKYCTTQSESDIHLAVCASYNFGSFYVLIYKFDCLPVFIPIIALFKILTISDSNLIKKRE